ncbi:MAG: hypothetical protein K9N46_09425 [Candidatus Marinimicrobia bacterium]|nr:hypothetical protein [Candidatus Neomarinimicrobiota bacterium]MCF7828462.1 hypothetical protein [Candidatus Neomarinimicrobiota bacterium]MCF7880944.1 hypothetical protein [Candidatus Neomarinimicrobiota bacterium]
MVGNPTAKQNQQRNQSRASWAYALVIIASLMLIGLPFLGPLFFVMIPILFLLTIPALIYFIFVNTKDKNIPDNQSR